MVVRVQGSPQKMFMKQMSENSGTTISILPDLKAVMIKLHYHSFSFIQWRTNLAAMSRVAAGQSLTVNQLVDMEWKFGGIF